MDAKIEIRVGSGSDIPKIARTYTFLESLNIPFSPRILSAHRTPEEMVREARNLETDSYRVSIAAAGGSAHLPGMTASETVLPVVGLPVRTRHLDGQDSLYSIIQMPDGVPVGCVGIGQDESAAILAAQIAYADDPGMRNKVREARGLDGSVPSDLRMTNRVAIITPTEAQLDREVYANLVGTLEHLELLPEEHSVSVTDGASTRALMRDLESGGASAVVAIGTLDDGNSTNYFPRIIAAHTDLPTIGLPLAEGYAGSSAEYIQGDIFHDMLAAHSLEEDSVGYPVAGMGVNRLGNAALYAAQIVGVHQISARIKVGSYRSEVAKSVMERDAQLLSEGLDSFLGATV